MELFGVPHPDRRRTTRRQRAGVRVAAARQGARIMATPCAPHSQARSRWLRRMPPMAYTGSEQPAISAANREGLDPMLAAWWELLLEMKKASVRVDEQLELP